MRIAVFGAGSVGGLFGGRLAHGGEDVTFIARGDHLAAIQRAGLRVDSIEGDFQVSPAKATANPAEIGPVDAVLVAVKAWTVADAARAMKPLVGPDTIVVPMQNGVEAPDQLAAELGAKPVLGGLCRGIATVTGPGHIKHIGISPVIAFGELDGRRNTAAEQLRDAFRRAGVTADIPSDIRSAMWEKFVLMAAWSGVGAITRAPAGAVWAVPAARRLLEAAMWEAAAVGRALGVAIPDRYITQALKIVETTPPAGMASMHRDLINGRPSELDAQNGAVVRLGQRVGVPTPIHSFIYDCLLPQELRARGELAFAT